MKRSGFTMVELIFVIVIIGILAATALPNFSGVTNKAKVNSELSAMSSLDGAITAAVEFRVDDFGDREVDWHGNGKGGDSDNFDAKDEDGIYKTVNDDKDVLKSILKKGDKFKIVGFVASNGLAVLGSGTSLNANDILFIKGEASDGTSGVALNGEDAEGKPDKNDVWVFNPNSFDLNITSADNGTALYETTAIVPAQSMTLVDVNGTTFTVTHLRAVNSTSGTAVAVDTVNF